MPSNRADLNDAEDWLHVFNECTSRVQLMQEAITKRNQKLEQGATSTDKNIIEVNAKLKTDLRTLGRDLEDLSGALSGLTTEISGREIQRRRDQLSDLMQRKDELSKLFSKKGAVNNANRSRLMGSDKKGKKKNKDEEPDHIKGLEHEQILLYQQQTFGQQDKNLDVLSDALTRTKHIGLAISDELDEHQVLLNDLDHNVNRTEVRIKKENRRLDKLLKSSKTPIIALCVIVILFCIVIALILIVLKFSNVL
jgi:chromosome segregation ATPase